MLYGFGIDSTKTKEVTRLGCIRPIVGITSGVTLGKSFHLALSEILKSCLYNCNSC